jgi:hypothetical protein
MKRILLTLAVAMSGYCSYAQDATYNNLTINNLTKDYGAANIYGWGNASDNTLDPRPNFRTDAVPFMINNHTGLTFSAHSLYGGIRFYNQGYPNPYDPATGSIMVMSIVNGNVGIGTTTPDAPLAVAGTIHSKEVKVDLVGWPDYVFKPAYNLPSLIAVKSYIDKNHRLPDMPSEQEVARNGINLGEIVKLQTKKIEELTLYLIEQQKQAEQQDARIAVLEKALLTLTNK